MCSVLSLLAATTEAFVPFGKSRASLPAEMNMAMDVPSMAQTHMQGPLEVNGSGKALDKEELERVKKELEETKAKYGLTEPVRSFMDDPDIKWRFGGKPDYSLTNLKFLQERTHVHPEGSLEFIVEIDVKTWEMER